MDHKATEDNIRYMMILSSFMIGIVSILLDYINEIGKVVSREILLYFAVFPMLYILSYFLLQLINKDSSKKSFQMINKLTILNFLLIGVFLFILVSHSFWLKFEVLRYVLAVPIWIMLASALVIFFLLLYDVLRGKKNEHPA